MTSVESAQGLLDWLVSRGGKVHPHAVVRKDTDGGVGLFTTSPIPAGDVLISCPLSAAITPALCRDSIATVTGVDAAALEAWNERQLAGAYISLHWRAADAGDEWPDALAHRAYVDALPPLDRLTTPLFFSEAERGLLQGTNLAGATADREAEWRAECDVVRALLGLEGLTWDRYRAVATYLSSRAFPSTLLQRGEGERATSADDAGAEVESHPVLFPGLDMLNHKRGQAITWLTGGADTDADAVPCVSFVAPEPLAPGEIFNNYGPRSNESLLLGYGFVIPDNADDTVVLRLGGAPAAAKERLAAQGLDAGARFELRRDGEIPQDLLKVLRVMLGANDHKHDHGSDSDSEDDHAAHEHELASLELELDVLGALGSMLDDKLAKLEAGAEAVAAVDDDDVRAGVRDMVETYRRGQMEILTAALDVLAERVERVEGLLADGPECPCGC